ncbi:hypothetical protein NRK67_01665 [Fusobacteria bacterium ZRK30]|nr:hypothetical protein NRK67_01665 [Fusobacteria bacterium ZRK30]
MDFKEEILKVITGQLDIEKILDKVGRTYGAIHKTRPIIYGGIKGVLIWDYIVWNELTFLDENKKITSLKTSFSDEEMEKEFNYHLEKYGI